MTDPELHTYLVNSSVLALDTSAFHGAQLFQLSDQINLWNEKFGSKTQLLISSLVYTERQSQERRRRGSDFELGRVQLFLQSKRIDIAPFTAEDSEGGSAWLAQRAPDQEAWQALKWDRLAGECKLDPSSPPKHVSATIDWFIAAQVAARGWILVTRDKGQEFKDLPLQIHSSQLDRVLAAELG